MIFFYTGYLVRSRESAEKRRWGKKGGRMPQADQNIVDLILIHIFCRLVPCPGFYIRGDCG